MFDRDINLFSYICKISCQFICVVKQATSFVLFPQIRIALAEERTFEKDKFDTQIKTALDGYMYAKISNKYLYCDKSILKYNKFTNHNMILTLDQRVYWKYLKYKQTY